MTPVTLNTLPSLWEGHPEVTGFITVTWRQDGILVKNVALGIEQQEVKSGKYYFLQAICFILYPSVFLLVKSGKYQDLAHRVEVKLECEKLLNAWYILYMLTKC